MKKSRIPAVEFKDYDEFEAGPPGSVTFATDGNGQEVNLCIRCPGCGEKSAMDLSTAERKPGGQGSVWNVTQRDPLTLFPSVHHTTEKGGCGWHGWLQNGVWVA